MGNFKECNIFGKFGKKSSNRRFFFLTIFLILTFNTHNLLNIAKNKYKFSEKRYEAVICEVFVIQMIDLSGSLMISIPRISSLCSGRIESNTSATYAITGFM